MSLQRPLHRYANLPDNSIRLLRLLPHKDEDEPIQCQLFNCSLESSRGTRPYEALSYVWGSDHGSQSISIGSCHQPVGENLFAALLHLRDPSIERILWIDALCINQQDNIEKGHQVQSMAMIYAKATRVIVWLGKATPGIDQALEDIRIASVAAEQTTTLAKNENAILKLLEAAWFRRVWVLQEVAAARHIVVRCGPAEIDGYAFFAGLRALKLPYKDYPGLQPLVMSIAYLAEGAAFRSRCATSQAGRFSLNISHLAQLVDMYHDRQASDNRDKIYALLGMSSDDPGASGLLVDYEMSWAKVFKQLVHSILGIVPVDTWDKKAVAVIRVKGCALGLVSSVDADIHRNGKQLLKVTWNSLVGSRRQRSYWELEASAEPVKTGDVVCLLQGATLPTVIRIHNDYWYIIVIAASYKSELPRLPSISPYDFLLVWDWDLCLDESQRGNCYEDLMGHLALKAPQAGLQTECERATRYWNTGVAMGEAQRSCEHKKLRRAIGILEQALRNMDSVTLASLGRDHRMMGNDMKELQRTIDLISKSEGGWKPLCLAAEDGCEVVARLLLDAGKVDLNAHKAMAETPLLKTARNGHERIVKLLLSTENINPDAKGAENHATPLAEAAGSGHEGIVKLLIKTGKVNVNAVCLKFTPLMQAAVNGHTAIVELLLSTGAVDPAFGFHSGDTHDTALSLAVRNGHEAIVEILLRVTQVPLSSKYWNYKYGYRYTLLSIAKETEHAGIIKLLQRAADFPRANG